MSSLFPDAAPGLEMMDRISELDEAQLMKEILIVGISGSAEVVVQHCYSSLKVATLTWSMQTLLNNVHAWSCSASSST